jgi:hypothetical protein
MKLVSSLNERTLIVFEKREQGRILGPKRDEVTGARRKLHNEMYDLYDLHSTKHY